jgi:hypothetical protein
MRYKFIVVLDALFVPKEMLRLPGLFLVKESPSQSELLQRTHDDEIVTVMGPSTPTRRFLALDWKSKLVTCNNQLILGKGRHGPASI